MPNESFVVTQVGSPIRFDCEEYGEIEPLLNSVNYINTNYDGWFSVNNESETYVGRDYETASEVRQRYASAVFRNSIGMKESIKAALLELQDVTSVTIYENRTDETVDGLKPHSFQAIVFGGDEEAIARTILNVAPLGIDTNGDICVRIEDSEGAAQDVCFSRPHEVQIYVKVIIKEYNEEILPGDAIDKIKISLSNRLANCRWVMMLFVSVFLVLFTAALTALAILSAACLKTVKRINRKIFRLNVMSWQ